MATYPHLFPIHYHLFPDMELRGVEPLSETVSPERLRVYPVFNLERSTPTRQAYLPSSVRFGTLKRASGAPLNVAC